MAGAQVILDDRLGRVVTAPTAGAYWKTCLHITKRSGTAVHRFANIAFGHSIADAYVHESLRAGPFLVLIINENDLHPQDQPHPIEV